MKKWLAFTLTGLISTGNLANAGVLAAVPASDQTIIDTLKCVRSIVEKQTGGREGLKISATYIDRLQKGENPVLDCLTTKKNTNPVSIAFEQQVEFVRNDETLSERARYVLGSFVRPKAACEKVGISAALALSLFGVNAKLDGAKCTATNGRVWLQVTPGLGWSASSLMGIWLGVNHGLLEREIQPTGVPVDFSVSYRHALAFFLGAETEGRELSGYKATVKGIGVGAAPVSGLTGEINFGLIPLGTKDNVFLDLMK